MSISRILLVRRGRRRLPHNLVSTSLPSPNTPKNHHLPSHIAATATVINHKSPPLPPPVAVLPKPNLHTIHQHTRSIAQSLLQMAPHAAAKPAQNLRTHLPHAHPPTLTLSALKAGFPGAAAAACQAASFMWISTAAAFQYRSGKGMAEAFRTLYAQGGVGRFYSGMLPTVIHVTTCRFGDTTANSIALQYAPIDSIAGKTACASVMAASWRAVFLPLETVRANMQVRGRDGMAVVQKRFRAGGFLGLYSGAAASFSAGLLGHFPFFFTVNGVSQAVPLPEDATRLQRMSRNGGMGFVASMCSDVVTNGFKIVATNKQTSKKKMTYIETARNIVSRDGLLALFTRGLKTRMIGNAIQGATFVLLWKELENRLVKTRFQP